MNAGDTGFMLICTAFVFFMTPGLAFFYGGLVRRKNVVNTMMACGAIMGLSVVMWTLFGYSLAFGGNHGGIIGDLRWFALNGVGWEPGPYADTIPHLVFVAFQMMFAMITPALITGAMLWFGWFGFNAGSALKADGLAAHAFMTSSISSACALLTWMLIEVIREGKPTLVGASTGLVIGLVAITPGAGFVPVWASFIIGILVSPICYFTVILLKQKLKIDDALDAFGCHGIGGIWGGIATGLFGKSSINSVAKWDGLVFGDYRLFLAQVLSIVITIAVAIVGTLICIGIVRIFTPLRVDPKEELVGLDASQHGENAYPSFNGFD